MRKNHSLLFLAAMAMAISTATLFACNHATLEDRAEKEARDFTERYCPTPVQNMQRTDSIVLDRDTSTFNYYYSLRGAADNTQAVAKIRDRIKTALLSDLKGDTGSKTYKEHGFNFRYVLHSEKTKEVLYEVKFTKHDYE